MKLLLDTNRYRDADNGQQPVVDTLKAAEEICVPTIVLGELRGGFVYGTRQAANESRLLKFLSSP